MKAWIAAGIFGMTVALSTFAQEKPSATSPSQVAQIQKQIELLRVHSGASPYLNIQEVGGEAIIQLARATTNGKTNWSLNIGYFPSKEKPVKALAAVGMTIPPTWQEMQYQAGTVAEYLIPQSDLAALPKFINDLFVKFFKRPVSYRLSFSIETDEPMPANIPTNIAVTASLGDDKRMNASDAAKPGKMVSLNGIISVAKTNGKLTEAKIGNVDDGMKTAYGIVLDAKGKLLAETGGFVHVTGRIEVRDGKNMLIVDDFGKK